MTERERMRERMTERERMRERMRDHVCTRVLVYVYIYLRVRLWIIFLQTVRSIAICSWSLRPAAALVAAAAVGDALLLRPARPRSDGRSHAPRPALAQRRPPLTDCGAVCERRAPFSLRPPREDVEQRVRLPAQRSVVVACKS